MGYPNVFEQDGAKHFEARINQLTPEHQPKWGKMNVAQMLAHLCVSYEMAYTDKHKKPGKFLSFILKLLVKKTVVGPKPYKKNSQTAPAFLITDERQFELEKKRLLEYIKETQEKGSQYFDGKESLSFGVLTVDEWNTLFSKHLDHHLQQFSV